MFYLRVPNENSLIKFQYNICLSYLQCVCMPVAGNIVGALYHKLKHTV